MSVVSMSILDDRHSIPVVSSFQTGLGDLSSVSVDLNLAEENEEWKRA
jgi:hypothetical protein